jgi:hypothetical protein
MVSIVDGTRQAFPENASILVRVLDGRKRAICSPWAEHASVHLGGLPYHGNNDDLYTLFAHARGYHDGAVYPVRLQQGKLINAAIMLVPENGQFHFPPLASWQAERRLANLIANGATNPAERYTTTYEQNPLEMGALLTIGTVLRDIPLDDAASPLDYYWEVRWDHLKRDRFWGWVEVGLAERVEKLEHMFAPEPDAALWHPAVPALAGAATRSWKETRLDAANIQLTFHENDRQDLTRPDGVKVHCVLVEPDIDYYKDVLAHGLCEVLPNLATSGTTDPRVAYQLRWMATKQKGLPEFAPPCTIE